MENPVTDSVIDPAVAELAALKAALAETATTVLGGVPAHLRALVTRPPYAC